MTLDIQALFNTHLPTWLAAHPDKARAIGTRFQINITGDGGGDWNIDASPTGPSVHEGRTKPADVGITLDVKSAQALFDDPAKGMVMFMGGQIKVTGNMMLAMKLGELMKLGEP